jgi:hypothetical protein
VGDEKVFRFKEILTMLWVSPVGWHTGIDRNEVGMERFFEANKRNIMGWIDTCNKIPHIHEILGHLGIAQAREPKVGSLWRVIPQEGDGRGLVSALCAFDSLIAQDVTPEQHRNLIDLVCRDLSLGHPEVLKGQFADYHLYKVNKLRDPCLRVLAQSYSGSRGDSFYLSSEDIKDPLKQSWARIATYFMNHADGRSLPSILRLQGSLWNVLSNQMSLCSTVLREPEVFVSGSVTFTRWLLNTRRLICSACSNTL